MPSLPLSPDGLVTSMHTKQPSSPGKYREVAYHLDGRDRYVAQSYGVRSPSYLLSPAPSPHMQHVQTVCHNNSSRYSRRTELHNPDGNSEKTVVVSQSVESHARGHQTVDTGVITSSRPVAPPAAPRQGRLSTPELFDTRKETSFCYCDLRKQDCVGVSCRRSLF